jgi:hypothetical protein
MEKTLKRWRKSTSFCGVCFLLALQLQCMLSDLRPTVLLLANLFFLVSGSLMLICIERRWRQWSNLRYEVDEQGVRFSGSLVPWRSITAVRVVPSELTPGLQQIILSRGTGHRELSLTFDPHEVTVEPILKLANRAIVYGP